MKRTLAVDLGAGLVVPTPVMVASGCAGTGRELGGLIDLRKVGAVVSRSITLEPDRGTSTPRIAESASGAVWSTGLQNPGIDAFIAEELPRLARGAHVIVSIAGGSLEAYVRMTGALQGRPDVAALEVHLSAPDVEMQRDVLGLHVDRAVEIVGAVARMSLVPVFAKIPLWASDVVELSRGAVRAGAHGLVLGGPPPALSVQAERLRPALGAVTGWLSGPAIKPMMLRAVFEVARAVPDVPIVAVGGIRSGEDAIEAMLAGAWAVQAGTAVLIDPEAPVRIAQGVVRYLKAKGLASPADIRGRLRVPASFGALEEEAAP
ncbi:MAG TPA: dihydroorotate dehydrogenase [Actinomycetota bacterium]